MNTLQIGAIIYLVLFTVSAIIELYKLSKKDIAYKVKK